MAALSAAPAACTTAPALDAERRAESHGSFGQLPLYFVENRGQLDPRVAYSVQGRDTAVYFTEQGMTFALTERAPRDAHVPACVPARAAVALDLVGARPGARPEGTELTGAVVSYFRGPRHAWQTGLRTYSSITYREAWPGIDCIISGGAGRLEYTFIVQPGADPRRIQMRYRGASSVKLERGGLAVSTVAGSLREEPPLSYQEKAGRREVVMTSYALRQDGDDVLYSFHLGPYDRNRSLVIDPVVLAYCGYIGGWFGEEATGVAVDAAGSAYVVGRTESSEATFPVSVGPDLTYIGNGGDVFVAKVRADGTGLVYCGYIAGGSCEDGNGIAVDALGNAYVTGSTCSNEATFPVTVGPDLTFNEGVRDAFVAKILADGTGLAYCGYVGGSADDNGNDVAVDANGAAYIVGRTSSDSTTFPVLSGPGLTVAARGDAFVAKVKADGTGLAYCGYIGGSGADSGEGIAIDAAGRAYVTGTTEGGLGFPSVAGPDLTVNGSYDAFVARVKADGSGLDYCGFIGGLDMDYGHDIAVDARGNAYVSGSADSSEWWDFPVSIGPDLTHDLSGDAFVAKVSADGSGLVYCGYIGGSGSDGGGGIAVDAAGRAHVAGATTSSEETFPVATGPDVTFNGRMDAFVAVVKADGTGFERAGYIGGSDIDFARSIALDADGNEYIVGATASTEATFPVTVGPDLAFNLGPYDAFVAKLSATPCDVAALSPPANLRGYKTPGGARFQWDADPAANEYHLNTVDTTAALHETDPTSVHQAPRGQGETQCTTTGLSCTDVDALTDPRPLLFYQVFSACGPTGADEGPMCPASDPCP